MFTGKKESSCYYANIDEDIYNNNIDNNDDNNIDEDNIIVDETIETSSSDHDSEILTMKIKLLTWLER